MLFLLEDLKISDTGTTLKISMNTINMQVPYMYTNMHFTCMCCTCTEMYGFAFEYHNIDFKFSALC